MKHNVELREHLYSGQTIAISGVDSAYYPKLLVKELLKSDVNDLTVIFNETNAVYDPDGDVADLIHAGKVTRLITSHLGILSRNWEEYLDYVEILPMDILAFKLQAGANHLPGIAVPASYAKLYRTEKRFPGWMKANAFIPAGGEPMVFEAALNADISLVVADRLDPVTFNVGYTGTSYNCMDIARCSTHCFAEAYQLGPVGYDETYFPGQYLKGYVKSETDKGVKTNWEEA